MTRTAKTREDQLAIAAGVGSALHHAFDPKEAAAEAAFDELIERLSRLSGGRSPRAISTT